MNVILANENGLVAATDSMLTFANPKRHRPIGVKLFKIDDRTLATMAGFYSAPGIEGLPELAAEIPALISTYIEAEKQPTKDGYTFAMKSMDLLVALRFELTSNEQAFLAAHPEMRTSDISPLEITLAGFDLDGSLKIAEFNLYAVRPNRAVVYNWRASQRGCNSGLH